MGCILITLKFPNILNAISENSSFFNIDHRQGNPIKVALYWLLTLNCSMYVYIDGSRAVIV